MNFNEREFVIGLFQRLGIPSSLILEKNITNDKTDYSHMAGIKERFFIKMLPALPCSALKLSTWAQYILYISTYLTETTRQFTRTGVMKYMWVIGWPCF